MSRATDVTGKLKGPVVPLNVCFTEEGKVDHTSMRRYANWLCEQQTPVLLLTYGSSEYAWLTDDDIRRFVAVSVLFSFCGESRRSTPQRIPAVQWCRENKFLIIVNSRSF